MAGLSRHVGRHAALLCLALSAASCAPGPPARETDWQGGASPYLLVFAGDQDGRDSDFLAVIDADPGSPRRGKVIATTPIGHAMSMPHHMEYALSLIHI